MKLLSRFISYYRPYRSLFAADMSCALVVCVIDLAFPQILNLLTRNVFYRSAPEIMRAVALVGAGLFVMYCVRYACQYFITSWGHIMGAYMERDMRQELFGHYQKLSFSYYDRNNTGEMMSRIVTDLFDVTELAHHGPETLLIATLKIAGAFAILLTMNVPMTLLLLGITLLMVLFSIRKNRAMRRIFTDNRRKIARVNSGVQDSLSGIRVVKSFGNEALEHRKFDRRNRAFLVSKIGSYRVMGSFHAGNSFFQGMMYVAVLVSGGVAIARGSLAPAELAIYALYIGIFIQPVEMLVQFTEQFQRGFSGFKRFTEVLETMPEVAEKPGAAELPADAAISYSNVHFSYSDEQEVLHGIDLEIQSGKTVALVGPSGGGKSTICALLPRFYDVSSGSVSIGGIDVRDMKLESLRRGIGIVQQDIYMFSGTIRDNILYGRNDATAAEVEGAARRAQIHDYIMSLPDGYDSAVGERGVRLSGGQKQRIAIARVFLKNPPILILDEATSALDNESELKIQQALAELSRGRTTLVIAHRLSTIRCADAIAVVESGRIVEYGTHNELIALQGIYRRYSAMQHMPPDM